MKAILFEGESESTLGLLLELAKKLGIKTRLLSDSEEEDIQLGLLMKEVKTGKLASRNEVVDKLKK